jgi:preprotein translocase subunit SecD
MTRTLSITLAAACHLGIGLAGAQETTRKPVLEFRIAADAKRDQAAVEKAKSPDGLKNPPPGYRWAGVDERYQLDLREGDIVREGPEIGGKSRKYLLVRLDSYGITEKDLSRAEKANDDRQRPAIRLDFTKEGGRRFGELTRTHLPEDTGGKFDYKHKLAIIIDGMVVSAPLINTEIRNAAIIELGGEVRPEEVDRLIQRIDGARTNK